MRFLISAILAGAISQASAQSSLPSSPATVTSQVANSRVLLIDEIELLGAGLDTDAEHHVPNSILEHEMQQYGADLLIDRANVVASADGLDITERVIEDARAGTSPPAIDSSVPAPIKPNDVIAQPTKVLVVDQATIQSAEAGVIGSSDTRRFQPIFDEILREREASIMIARSAVVLGTINIDVTNIAIERLKQSSGTGSEHTANGAVIPDANIMILDRNVILSLSKVGQSIVSQVNDDTNAAEGEFRTEAASLRTRENQLKESSAHLSDDARADQNRNFEADRSAFTRKVQTRQAQIKNGVDLARQQVERALGSILRTIMVERGANLLLDSAAVRKASAECDVTSEAINMLDKELPTIKVSLDNSSAHK
jgi:Skp family chaperone for outer membrane proteins